MMKLTVLGCGDAFAANGRFTTSFLIGDDKTSMLIDCGASVLPRLKQLEIDPISIDIIFITHFHGDHYGGLPFLMISYAFEQKRKNPLTIIGPSGIENQVKKLQEALYPETSRLFDEVPISFIEYTHKIQNINEFSFQGLPVKHSPPSIPHGVRVTWNDKTFAFSGDTEWTDTLMDLARDTEIFICECNNYKVETPGHLSYSVISEKKDQLDTKRLILTHMGSEALKNELSCEKLHDGQEIDLW